MCVAADPNRPRLIVEKARRRKEMLGMPKRYSQLASSTHIPFKSSAAVVDSKNYLQLQVLCFYSGTKLIKSLLDIHHCVSPSGLDIVSLLNLIKKN